MRKYRKVLHTHLALVESVSFIKLIRITDLEMIAEVRVKNDHGEIEMREMFILHPVNPNGHHN